MSEERRLVTVLFADVVGSTALGEALDPEDLRALLGRYYAIAREVVDGHGGTVEKFIGDAVMAVFGLPVVHDDDPDRALSAALALRDRVRSEPSLGERLPIRLGVQTGEVVAAVVSPAATAAADSLVTGDAVNTAARLQQAAEPWQILVGERTARAARGFAFDEGQPIDAKGKVAPLPCRRLRGRLSERRLRVPLVGREADLSQLELTAGRAFRERRPYLVSVIAAPGVGKSRLLEEFLERLPAIAPDARVALAQCLPYGQRLTFWPLRAIAHSVLGLPEDASSDMLRAEAARWLTERDEPAADRKADLIAATVGGGEVEGVDRASLADAWRSLVELASAERPLVLAIEDLHWSSDSLLDLIEAVLQPRGESRLFMVVLARPELLDRRPTWGGGRRNYVSLALEPLDDPDVARLVEHLLDGPSPEIVRLVVGRAEGNPFYAGEIVRSVVERASDLRDADAVAAAVTSLPDTVQATVLSRIDVLPPPVRRAIQLGAVFGRTFRADGLQAIDSSLGDELPAAVEALIDRDLVRPTAKGVAFRHILIREVAYGTLPRSERARLHAAAARWLADSALGREEELAELIAFHFREAATLAAISGELPADLAREAVRWLALAAESAAAGAANLEAAGHLGAAIELAESDRRMALYERLGDVLVSGNTAIEAYAEALTLAEAGGAPPADRLRIAGSELMVHTRWTGSVATLDIERVERLRQLGLELLPSVSDRAARGRFLAAFSFVPSMVAGLGEAALPSTEAATEALAIAEELDDPNLISAALDSLGARAFAEMDVARAAELSRQRLAMAGRLDSGERSDAEIVQAWSLLTLGRPAEAVEHARAVESFYGPGQALGYRIGARAWEVSALWVLGRWDETVVAARRLAELWTELGGWSVGYAAHGFVRTMLLARARQDRVLEAEFASIARDLLDQFDERRGLWALRFVVDHDPERLRAGLVDRWRGHLARLDQVEIALAVLADHAVDPGAAVRELISETEARGLRLVEAQARRALGVAAADGAELERSLHLFAAMDAGAYLPRVQAELGLLGGDDELYERGVAGLERLGDVAELERLASRRHRVG
ncbi:MAG TPA: adenylate/guanylate cyclase domain-containing protein [Candidatus Limnocylindrales bacterium]|nr:adenylate/guanylate cyclase domain-containing protein [Candidatus Limnocylindrales bacterium]